MSGGITDQQRAAIDVLAAIVPDHSYLAGGVAIALELHHRISLDIDVFVPQDFDSERLAESVSATAAGTVITGRAPSTLHMEVLGVPTSLLSYRYPLLCPPRSIADLPMLVASLDDLVCMKVSAIAGRGAAKDFWDLEELLSAGVADGSLSAVMQLYRRKFPVDDIGHAVRALAYFGDADVALLPRGLTPERWGHIKAAIAQRVKQL